MKLHFTEFPVFINDEVYNSEINRMAERLMCTGKVQSVFQVGGVSHPGISDIDLFVVFKDAISYVENPVKHLSFPANYLFSHRLFGTSISHARELEQYTFFGTYKHIAGDLINMHDFKLDSNSIQLLERQIALEYLIKAWIAINIGIEYRLIKLRSFLLHAKGIRFDIRFLSLKNAALENCINRIMEIRDLWFEKQPTRDELQHIVFEYRNQLEISIIDALKYYNFYFPQGAHTQISKNISLTNGARLNFERIGIAPSLSFIGKFKLLTKAINRFNHFIITLPMTEVSIPKILVTRHNVIKNTFEYNSQHLPHFIGTGHAMNIFQQI